jgi:hypothetical protein
VTGLGGSDPASAAATWVAAIVTLVVLGGLLGERRAFGWAQHLLAGLATGFLALLVLGEVIGPRLVAPLVDRPDRVELWLGLALVGVAAGSPWLPRVVAAVPLSIAVGALAAFALGGAVIGTLLPQLAAAMARPDTAGADLVVVLVAAAVTAVVLLAFLRGTSRGRIAGPTARAGRWLLVAGVGGWLGYLLLGRLVLLLDRLAFLLGDWLGMIP